jgi:hypothetical protein
MEYRRTRNSVPCQWIGSAENIAGTAKSPALQAACCWVRKAVKAEKTPGCTDRIVETVPRQAGIRINYLVLISSKNKWIKLKNKFLFTIVNAPNPLSKWGNRSQND